MNKIKELRKSKGITQKELAEALDMSQPNLSKIEADETPLTVEIAQKISLFLNIDVSDIISNSAGIQIPSFLRAKKRNDEFAEVEIISATASCGNGVECLNSEVIGKHLISKDCFRQMTQTEDKYIKILPISGDSMQPTINNNDYVMVDMSIKSPTGDGLYLLCIRNDLFVKRIRFDFIHNTATILSDNPLYPPLETNDPDGIKVLGKIICINKMLS